jgi:hypothetical protein
VQINKESVHVVQHGHTVVGTTAAKLTQLNFSLEKGVLIRAPGGDDPNPNTDPVWIGGASVTADAGVTGGVPLVPGASVFIPVDDPSVLWVISTASSQDVAWIGA